MPTVEARLVVVSQALTQLVILESNAHSAGAIGGSRVGAMVGSSWVRSSPPANVTPSILQPQRTSFCLVKYHLRLAHTTNHYWFRRVLLFLHVFLGIWSPLAPLWEWRTRNRKMELNRQKPFHKQEFSACKFSLIRRRQSEEKADGEKETNCLLHKRFK